MAKEIITTITDDLDGSPDAKEIKFSLDGVEYVIDLNVKHETELREALEPFVEAARLTYPAHKTRGRQITAAGQARQASADRRRTIREWWQANYEAAELHPPTRRGKIPDRVVAAFERHGGRPVSRRAGAGQAAPGARFSASM